MLNLSRDRVRRGCVAALLCLHLLLVVTSSWTKSAVIDEPFHVAAGAAALFSGDFRLSTDSPPLINLLCALPLAALPKLELPFEHPAWRNPRADVQYRKREFAEFFFWRQNVGPWKGNAQPVLMIRLARLPVALLSVLLGLLVYIAAARLFGSGGAVGALALYCFCPSVLAHAGLATTDLGGALGIFAAGFALWRYLEEPAKRWLLLSGLTLGAALLCKQTAFFLLAFWPVIMIWNALSHGGGKGRRLARALGSFGVIVVIALLTVWAGYGFELHSIHDPARLLSVEVPGDKWLGVRRALIWLLAEVPLPPRTYYYGVAAALLARAAEHYPVYFFGQVRESGWWYYYPLLFLMKAPLALLAMMGTAVVWRKKLPAMQREAALVMSITSLGLLLLFMLFNPRTIGLRHLLPLFPFLYVSLGRLFSAAGKAEGIRRGAVVLLVLYAANAGISWPDYLVHFNWVVGGPEGGLRYSVVGEDWGQDLPALAKYCRQKGIDRIYYYAYTGADPKAYGIPAVKFSCGERAPGWYAFQVVDLRRPRKPEMEECLREFRESAPEAVLHHTVYVFRRE